MMFAHPCLVEAQTIHRHDQIEVPFERESGVLSDGMEGGHEISEAHLAILTVAPVPQAAFGGRPRLTALTGYQS